VYALRPGVQLDEGTRIRVGLTGRPGGDVPQAASHAEVDQERAAGLEPDYQVLAATVDRLDALAGQLGGDLERVERAGQARVEDLDPVESAADERGLEPAADGLDLGQLGHGARVVRPARVTARSAEHVEHDRARGRRRGGERVGGQQLSRGVLGVALA